MRNNLKWIIPSILVVAFFIYLFSTSGMSKISADFAQAYADPTIYEMAIEKANVNQEVLEKIGMIKPIGKMTILNGEVRFSNNSQTVNSTIKVEGEKAKGKMDILANRTNEKWIFEKINIRIKDSAKNKKTIQIIPNL